MAAVRITMQTTPRTTNSLAPNLSHVEYSTCKGQTAHDGTGGRREQVHKAVAGGVDHDHGLHREVQLMGQAPRIGMETVAMPEDDGIRKDSTM